MFCCGPRMAPGLTDHEAQVCVGPGERKVAQGPVVEGGVPADVDIVARLALLHGLVIVSLQLHQGAKNILVCIRILISGHHTHKISPDLRLQGCLDRL